VTYNDLNKYPEWRALRCVLDVLDKPDIDSGTPKDHVTTEGFQKFNSWFGPLIPGEGPKLIKLVLDIINQPWFHGTLSYQQAYERLLASGGGKSVTKGSYLVRAVTQEEQPQYPNNVFVILYHNTKTKTEEEQKISIDHNQVLTQIVSDFAANRKLKAATYGNHKYRVLFVPLHMYTQYSHTYETLTMDQALEGTTSSPEIKRTFLGKVKLGS